MELTCSSQVESIIAIDDNPDKVSILTLLRDNSNVNSLGNFNTLSTDTINHIFTFLGNDVKQLSEASVQFHTIVSTTSAYRDWLNHECDILLAEMVPIVAHIKAADDNTLDILYQIIMKKPMSQILALDAILKKGQVLLNYAMLNVLCQVEIFVNHYQTDMDKDLLPILVSLFIRETLNRMTLINATFCCITRLINKDISEKVISQINSARNTINEHANNGTMDQQGILMRLATAVSLSWDLMDKSECILKEHQDIVQSLCSLHEKMRSLYKLFMKARIKSAVYPENFDLNTFIGSVFDTITSDAF